MFAYGWGAGSGQSSTLDKTNPRSAFGGLGIGPDDSGDRPPGLNIPIAQPRPLAQPLAQPKPHPGAIGTPVLDRLHEDGFGPPEGGAPRPRSAMEQIQADFPRTASPLYTGVADGEEVTTAAAVAALDQLHRVSPPPRRAHSHGSLASSAADADQLHAPFNAQLILVGKVTRAFQKFSIFYSYACVCVCA